MSCENCEKTKNDNENRSTNKAIIVLNLTIVFSGIVLLLSLLISILMNLSLYNLYFNNTDDDKTDPSVFLNVGAQINLGLSVAKYDNIDFLKITDLDYIYFEKIPLMTSEKNAIYFEKSPNDQYSLKLKANEKFCTNLYTYLKPNSDFGCNYESGNIIAYYNLK